MAIVIKTTRMALHGSRPAHRSDPPRAEARARQDDRPHPGGAHRCRGHLHLGAAPRRGQVDAAHQPAARWLFLRTPPPRHVRHEDRDGPLDSADPQRRQHRPGVRQRLPAPPVTRRRRLRSGAPARMSVSRVDLRPRRQPRRRTRQGGLSRNTLRPSETDRATCRRMCGLPVDIAGSRREARHPGLPRAARRRTGVLGYRPMVAIGREGARLPDQLEARHRHVCRELSLRDGAQGHLCDHRAQQLHGVRLLRPPPPTCLSPQRNSRSREPSRGAVGSTAQHGGHLRAVPEHRVVVHHREWRVVPRLSRRRTRSVDHCAPELNSVGSVRRIGGRRRGGGLRLRACHGPRRGLRPRGRPAGQPRIRRPGALGFRPQRTWPCAPPSNLGRGDQQQR